MKVRWSRALPSTPSTVTVIKDAADRYFASFVVETDDKPLLESVDDVGIDLGLTHFAVLSDATKVSNPRFLRRAGKKLKKALRALSRQEKGSSNRAKVARAHAGWLTAVASSTTSSPRRSSTTTKRCTSRTCV